MKLTIGARVQWEEPSGALHVGRVMLETGEPVLGFHGGEVNHLVRHAHTGELEFVPRAMLQPYPRTPIPEPA
jgi:hypothetical protein